MAALANTANRFNLLYWKKRCEARAGNSTIDLRIKREERKGRNAKIPGRFAMVWVSLLMFAPVSSLLYFRGTRDFRERISISGPLIITD